MAQFNLNDYETVEERLKRAWAKFEEEKIDARLVTVNHTSANDRAVGTWIVEARLYLSATDQELDLPKVTGWAFEVDGGMGANKTSALENAETSAIGRCLANWSMSGNKRASRSEMEKVERGVTPQVAGKDWLTLAADMGDDLDGLRLLYSQAKTAKAPADVLAQIQAIAETKGA